MKKIKIISKIVEIYRPRHTALSFKNSEIIAEKCLFYSEIP